MTALHFAARPLALAALLCAAGAAHADITVNTNFASFLAATNGSADSFSDLTINTDVGASAIARSAGPYAYTASAQSNLFVIPAAGTIALSTGIPTDSITFSGFVTPVRAVGANFYASNVLGEVASGALTVVATDINGLVRTQAVAGNSLTGFVGFLSDAPLASVVVSLTVANEERYVTVDNVVLSAVPEASSWLMMLAGGAVALRIGSRRRG